jgi:hypothetical protein
VAAAESKMTTRRISACSIIVLVSLALGPSSVAAALRSDSDPQATLIQLIEFSNQQALNKPEARTLLTDEALKWNGRTFGKLAAAPDKVVLINPTSAVGRVQCYAENNDVNDLYFYLSLDGAWKVRAMRALALTGIVRGAYQYLKSKPARTAAEEEELANMQLVLASDEFLRDWFKQNTEGMNNLYLSSRVLRKGDFSTTENLTYSGIRSQLKPLHLSYAEAKENGNIEFVIGGVTDNTVGFLYSPANQPPPISSNEYIWVEEVAPKWFLFRTT